jgi:hypothetical protein
MDTISINFLHQFIDANSTPPTPRPKPKKNGASPGLLSIYNHSANSKLQSMHYKSVANPGQTDRPE